MAKTVTVQLLVSRCTDRASQQPGQMVEVSADEAKRMIDNGIAQPAKRLTETRG